MTPIYSSFFNKKYRLFDKFDMENKLLWTESLRATSIVNTFSGRIMSHVHVCVPPFVSTSIVWIVEPFNYLYSIFTNSIIKFLLFFSDTFE